MKLTVKELEILIEHTLADLSYGVGGSYTKINDDPDTKAIKYSESAIRKLNEEFRERTGKRFLLAE